MAYDYDALYRTTPDALGPPTPALVVAFDALPAPPLRILDVGCGQGRDALFLGRLGHRVLGVDLSPSGIAQLSAAAVGEGLAVSGEEADITTYTPSGLFDVVLVDRTLHMLEASARLVTLARLLDHVAEGGWCIIADEPRNLPSFLEIADRHAGTWSTVQSRRGRLVLRRLGPAQA